MVGIFLETEVKKTLMTWECHTNRLITDFTHVKSLGVEGQGGEERWGKKTCNFTTFPVTPEVLLKIPHLELSALPRFI